MEAPLKFEAAFAGLLRDDPLTSYTFVYILIDTEAL
jgi:hypothetical protein